LWLIKHWFSASTFVVKIATFAKPQNVSGQAMTTVQTETFALKINRKENEIYDDFVFILYISADIMFRQQLSS